VIDLNTETSIAVVTETQYNLVRFGKLWLVGCAIEQAILVSHFELDILRVTEFLATTMCFGSS